MPNTLAATWTWDKVPKWERTILQSVGLAIKEAGFVITLRDPDTRIRLGLRYCSWYGIDVWTGSKWWNPVSWFVTNRLAIIYCDNNVLSLWGKPKSLSVDLYDPKSIDRVIEALKECEPY